MNQEEMNRAKILELLRGGGTGVRKWNDWRDNSHQIPDLQGVDLRRADLRAYPEDLIRGQDLPGVNLEDANLEGADLQGANLYRADLQNAKLKGAKLNDAYLREADLRGANLQNSDLRRAKLYLASLQCSNLQQADLRGADLVKASLRDADLRGADIRRARLDYVDLQGSRYDRYTRIPAGFYASERGMKLVDDVSGPSPQNYDLFLSHASEDKESIARPLYTALKAAGVSVWFDEAVLELGDKLRQKIDEGLARCQYGVVILSPRFFNKDWPQRELDGLVARETASGEKAILPIWHELDRDSVLRYSPPLADRLAGRSEEGVPSLVAGILRVLKK